MSAATDYIQLTHAASEIDGTIDEVYAARGSYGNLGARIGAKQDELSQAQQEAVDSGITAAKLTADEAALVELVDSGAKNLLLFDTIGSSEENIGTSILVNGITFTIQDDRTITAYGTAISGAWMFFALNGGIENFVDLFDGKHIWSGLPEGYTSNEIAVFYKVNGGSSITVDPVSATLPNVSGSNVSLGIQVQKNQSYTQESPLVIKPMICTATDYAVSPKFVPYRPSWQDMADSNKIIDITSQITAGSGYTVESTSHLYLQNNIVFGSIAIAKDSGSYSSSLTAVAKLPEKYAPFSQFINMCGFSTEQWGVTNIGYAFIQTQNATSASQRGQISVKSPTASLNHLLLQVNYPIRLDDTLLSGASTQSVQPTLMSAAKPMIDAEEVSEKEAEPDEVRTEPDEEPETGEEEMR